MHTDDDAFASSPGACFSQCQPSAQSASLLQDLASTSRTTGLTGFAPGHLHPVVEGARGSVFFKFTGPAKTVAQNQAPFEKMLSTLNPQ
jgi:hypothetical protein